MASHWLPFESESTKTNFKLIQQLKRYKNYFQRRQNMAKETDFEYSDTLTYRIELINILLAEFGQFQHPKSLKNLLHRPKF